MIIYKVENKINKKVYIGKTIKTLIRRKNQHLNDTFIRNSKTKFHNALRKYKDNFTWEIIDKTDNINELNKLEIYYISLYNSFKNGYNSTTGGEGCSNRIVSDKTKEKLKNVKLTDEQQKRRIDGIIKNWINRKIEGKNIPWNKGKKTNQIPWNKGKKTNQIPWNKNIIRKEIVYQYDKDNNLIKEWKSIDEAISFYKNRRILDVVLKKRKTASGFIWKINKKL